MNKSNDWLPWRESAAKELSRRTLVNWRKKHGHQPPILRREIHWRYGRGFRNQRIVLINSQLVTPEFVAEYYHPTRPRGSGSEQLNKHEVERLVELYGNEIPDYLIPACKRFGIPIPVAEDH